MATQNQRIPLTHLAGKLRERVGPTARIPNYRSFWNAAVDGRLPGAETDDRGRWTVPPSSLPAIEEMFVTILETAAA